DEGDGFHELEGRALLRSEVLRLSPGGEDGGAIARLAAREGIARVQPNTKGASVELRRAQTQQVGETFGDACPGDGLRHLPLELGDAAIELWSDFREMDPFRHDSLPWSCHGRCNP